MLQRSHPTFTVLRRPGSQESSSARFFTVHARNPYWLVRLSVLTALFILGMLAVLFFNCVATLLNPVYRRAKCIKWGLASYATVMFSLATVYVATNAYTLSNSYVDNRDFPGGPYVYQNAIAHEAISVVPRTAFRLNNWSADGLLVSSPSRPGTHP